MESYSHQHSHVMWGSLRLAPTSGFYLHETRKPLGQSHTCTQTLNTCTLKLNLRPVHLDSTMCIECASNPPHEVDSKWIQTGFQYSREVMPTLWSSACTLAWLVAHIISLLSVLLLVNSCDVGEKRGLFSDGLEEWYSMVKWSKWFCCATLFQCILTACSATYQDKPQNS